MPGSWTGFVRAFKTPGLVRPVAIEIPAAPPQLRGEWDYFHVRPLQEVVDESDRISPPPRPGQRVRRLGQHRRGGRDPAGDPERPLPRQVVVLVLLHDQADPEYRVGEHLPRRVGHRLGLPYR